MDRLSAMVAERVEARRRGIVAAAGALGVEARVEGEVVRLSGPGLKRRWMGDLALREAGRNSGGGR
ncbi:hypothetical protein [Sphingobium chungbukense]|uniref:Uncharacterized protein n=1 Tax=Sphingobium chungbukense TaxID=56193 RepID=A0A0M3AR40_9SPHN|nr:hypothetical protein [Sphingobium chungbukense]KKW91381.1 hypothetical protein YP76_15645 [Sphingobium chungbukense]